LHYFDRRDLSVELEGLPMRVDNVEVECTTVARQLLWFVTEISNALVDLGMLPVQDIP
jgi:hypothetical protein